MTSRESAHRSTAYFLVSLAALMLLASGVVSQERQSIHYSYAERSTGVLEVHFLSSTVMETVQFAVHGDGRVLGKVVGTGPDQPVLDEFGARLDAAQVSELVDEAVTSGLIDFETDRFIRELRKRGETFPNVIDGGAVLFKIDLDYVARGDESLEAPFSHSFLIDFPDEFARRFPEERALRALQRVTHMLEGIYWSHRRRQ